ncbi:MAG: hypothetical protein ABR884_03675 [Minisyncoccia bacterium]|jgi:uncharacterized protein YoxC
MDTLIHADIFFFVTTVAVIVVGIAFTIALIYLANVLSDIKEITKQVKEETILFREDMRDLRSDVKHEGFRVERFVIFIKNLFKKTNTRSKKEVKKE